jgi:Spy/CpxP family protein refolding chaperone
MRYSLIRTLGLIVVTAIAGPLHAQSGPGTMPTAPPRLNLRARPLSALGLTPPQRRQLNQMRKTTHAEQSRLGSQIRSLRSQLAALYRAYPLDQPRAAALVEQISQMEAQRLRLQLQIQVELRRILTPDQFGRFTQIMDSGQRPKSSALSRVP